MRKPSKKHPWTMRKASPGLATRFNAPRRRLAYTHTTHTVTHDTRHTHSHTTHARAASPQPRAPCLSAEGPSMALSHAESTVTSRSGLSLVTAPLTTCMRLGPSTQRGCTRLTPCGAEGDALPAADACGPDGGRGSPREIAGEVHRDARAGGTEGSPRRSPRRAPAMGGQGGARGGDATRPSSVAHARI